MISSIYSQTQLAGAEQQFTEQQAALEERLAGDTTVVASRQKLANAQASLEQLQNQTRTLPYEQRVKYLGDITAQKQAITDAKKELQVAVNDNAKRYHQVKLEEERAQEQRRVAARQEQHAAQQQVEAKRVCKPHYLVAGWTAEQFEQAWESEIWPKERDRRATEQVAAAEKAHYDL